MMTETGMIGVKTSGREEFNPQQNLLGRTAIEHLPQGGRQAIRRAPYKII